MTGIKTKAVANCILDLSKKSKVTVDAARLQALVYFAHGWHLAIHRDALIAEDIEAHKLGVSITSILDNCMVYGGDHVTKKLSEYDNKKEEWIEPELARKDPAIKLVARIWDVYGNLSDGELRKQTTGFGTPWYQVNPGGEDSIPINNRIIQEYFINLAHIKGTPGGKEIDLSAIQIDQDIQTAETDQPTADDLEGYESSFHRLLTDKRQTKWKKVRNYAVLWNPGKRKGIIKITLDDGVDYKVVVKSVDELNCITDMLRFEKNIFYNIVSGSFASGWVPLQGKPRNT